MPESDSSDSDQRKLDDETSLKTMIQKDMKLINKDTEIENPVRLGRKIDDSQPDDCINHNNKKEKQKHTKKKNRLMRFKVGKFEDKRQILQGNSELKNIVKNGHVNIIFITPDQDQDKDQDSLLVKRRNDNHSPGPVIRELVPSSHQRSELSNTILCIFSG